MDQNYFEFTFEPVGEHTSPSEEISVQLHWENEMVECHFPPHIVLIDVVEMTEIEI
jgi:hypothetical protein